MNPYGAPPPGGARPPPPGAPGYFTGPPASNMPGPPSMAPPGGLARPPTGFAPSSFPQGTPPPRPAPTPTCLPPPRPTARPSGPPPSLQPPGQTTPPNATAAGGALPAAAAAGTTPAQTGKPALKTPEPVKKLMASVTFIAPSVENEFLDKLFAVFGAVKSMKRPVDPSTNKGKAFAFVEYEAPESLKRALKVLPNQTIDGQDIQVKPTNPSKQYLDWWEAQGRAAADAAAAGEPTEDGEAAIDEDSAEMEATEAVMDLVSQRGGGGGGGGGGRERGSGGRGDRRGDDRGGSRGGDTDALIRGVAQEANRAEDRHVRLEREFEADRARRDREQEKERRRDRKLVEDLMRQVRAAESDAARERNRRAQRMSEMRDRRQHLLKQDNDASRREEEDEGDKWWHTARQERLREAEADEADRMRELEEEASRRGAANAAAAASFAEGPPAAGSGAGGAVPAAAGASAAAGGGSAAASGVPPSKGIVDMNDSIMKAMMQQVSGSGGQGGAANGADAGGAAPMDATPASNGGWSALGGSTGGLRLGGTDAGKSAAATSSTKKAFFGAGTDENKPRPGAWVMEQRAKAAAEGGAAAAGMAAPAADAAAVAAPDGSGAAVADGDMEQRQAQFESERSRLMQKIPTTLEDAAEWPLRADALRLESPVAYKHLLSRVVKYVHEVMPSDEEAIANEVLTRVKAGDTVRAVQEFCSFLGEDANKFTLKLWRLLIAESELAILRNRYGIAAQ